MKSGPWKPSDHPLCRWRVAKRLSQEELADLAGVPATTISRLERNEGVRLHWVRRVLALKPGDFTAEYYVMHANHR